MGDPMVVCIMLTRDRPEMARRAIKSYREQTYARRILLIADSGQAERFEPYGADEAHWRILVTNQELSEAPIGALRNAANRYAAKRLGERNTPDIFVHFDDDDVSHPNRIAEQVALLKASKKECVGYSDLLFWRECEACKFFGPPNTRCDDGMRHGTSLGPRICDGEAWLWKQIGNSLPGTSLCYWREVWERKPFPDLPKNNASMGEDTAWLRGVDALGVSSLGAYALADELRTPAGGWTRESLAALGVPWPPPKGWMETLSEPRLIASIHGGNTMHYGDDLLSGSTSWMRVPAMDAICRDRMTL